MGKCIRDASKLDPTIHRVSDGEARKQVKTGKFTYTTKSKWRSYLRRRK